MIWEPPRMSQLTMVQRFRDEKWRKLTVDSLPWPHFQQFSPDFARYLGRKYYNPANKPVALSLNLWWVNTPPGISQIALPLHTNHTWVFEYRFSPEDFM